MFALANIRSQYAAIGMLGSTLLLASPAAAHDDVESRSARAEALARQGRASPDATRVAALTPQLTQLVLTLPHASLAPRLSLRLRENAPPPNAWDAPLPVDASVLQMGALLTTGVTLFVLAPSADNQDKNALRVAARYASGGGRLSLEGVW